MASPNPLDPCVHCGFCLPACPTYLATGDEADSPRGRIVLMRALTRGEIGADDPALVQHLDACLGCRGCEPVCPSGVAYGQGLEAARETLARQHGIAPRARLALGIFRTSRLWRPLFTAARFVRNTRLPSLLAGPSRIGFGMAMLDATRAGGVMPPERDRPLRGHPGLGSPSARSLLTQRPLARGGGIAPPARVAVFRGCIMDTLFQHVHEATRRTLTANGYEVIEVEGQTCCGALHDHAGDRPTAQSLATRNIAAFLRGTPADFIVVNSAGCGALLKAYGDLIASDAAQTFASRVRDVSELLAAAGPRPGAPLPVTVAYDAPCHLQHAQRVHDAPLALLRAIPDLDLQLLPDADRCCGSAGIYSLLQPAMSRAVLDAKIATIAAATPQPALVATGNPGCLMQIGAGLRAAGLAIGVAHPVELLDWSYQLAGYDLPLGSQHNHATASDREASL